jgi:ankyrin repeat protein
MIKHTIAALALTLSLAASAVQAQDTNCDGWMSSDWEVNEEFWRAVTVDTVSDCLNSGSDVNARGGTKETPLLVAVFVNDNPEVITVLLDAGANLNARNDREQTPLHRAAFINNNLEVLTVLLDAGADVNARDVTGAIPLHKAANFNDNPEVITVLLDNGSDGTAVDGLLRTPFDLAQDNDALAGTDAYWALSDARHK